jgi:peptidoglycan/xylan/chitin deacetylase (PgdA/CDA1 family)
MMMGAFFIVVVIVSVVPILYLVYRPPPFLIAIFERRWPEVLFHVHTRRKLVALTIDDGPSSHTSQIAEVLRDEGVTATFFLIGSNIPGREKVLQELLTDGNELANHAMHPLGRCPWKSRGHRSNVWKL